MDRLPQYAFSDPYIRKVIPAVLHRLVVLLLEPVPEYMAIGDCLATDPALAMSVARMAALSQQELARSHFPQLAAACGPGTLLDFALSYSLQRDLAPQETETAFCVQSWEQAVLRSETARLLARRVAPAKTEGVYFAALIRDVMCERLADSQSPDLLNLATLCSLPVNVVRHALGKGGDGADPEERLVAVAAGVPLVEALAGSDIYLTGEEVEQIRLEARERLRKRVATYRIVDGNEWAIAALSHIHNLRMLVDQLVPRAEGLDAIAAGLGRHLADYWGIDRWELALNVPGSTLFHYYVAANNGDKAPLRREGAIPLAGIEWKKENTAISLDFCSQCLGEIRIPEEMAHPPGLATYLRLVSFALMRFSRDYLNRTIGAVTANALPQGIARFSSNGYLVDANPLFLERFLHTRIPSRTTVFSLFRQRFGVDLRHHWDTLLQSDETHLRFSLVARSIDLTEQALIVYLTKLENGRECLLQITPNPWTAIREKNEMEQKEFFAGIVETLTEEVLILSRTGFIEWSSARPVGAGESFFDRYQPASSFFEGAWDSTLFHSLTESRLMECSLSGPDADFGLLEISLTPMGGQYGHKVMAVIRDMGMARAKTRTRSRVSHDALTGLFSHSHFQSLFDREERKSKTSGRDLGLLFIDIDRFGQFNRIYGYQTGDAILRRVAAGIKASVRSEDTVARYGRDEFAIMVPGANKEMLEEVAARIWQAVRSNCRGAVDLRCGLGLCGKQAESYRLILANVRQACYREMHEAGGFVWADCLL